MSSAVRRAVKPGCGWRSPLLIEFRVSLVGVKSFDDFVGAFNVGFIHLVGGDWNGNLDALNDYLFWPVVKPYRLIVSGWSGCVEMLGELRGA